VIICRGSGGKDPLVFNSVILKYGHHMAHSKNELFKDFLKVAHDVAR
jgi:hypothetical protein